MQKSSDGTIKNAIELFDGFVVECVLIPTKDRITACVSSQVGCSLNCKFCATASMKKKLVLINDMREGSYHGYATTRIDHSGIYNNDLNKHTHSLRYIKKII